MLLTLEQMKHLASDGEETYKFIGRDVATMEEIKQLRELDESHVDLYGFHMVSNYEELK
jgi:hypothetical protein